MIAPMVAPMIVLGRILTPYGVKGWLRVHPFGDDPQSWRKMSTWWLSVDPEAATTDWIAYELDALKLHGDGVVVKLVGVDDRAGAEAMQGRYVGAHREGLPSTQPDEYYWADLIGLSVVNAQGVALGRVKSLIETGANDVLVIEDGEQERLVPFIEPVLLNVDVPGGLIRVEWGADW